MKDCAAHAIWHNTAVHPDVSEPGLIDQYKPDLLIVGELNEWETSEYVRDMRHMGAKTSLVVLGHIQSEEPGLKWLVEWLQPQLPGVRITHVPSKDAFRWA